VQKGKVPHARIGVVVPPTVQFWSTHAAPPHSLLVAALTAQSWMLSGPGHAFAAHDVPLTDVDVTSRQQTPAPASPVQSAAEAHWIAETRHAAASHEDASTPASTS